MTLNLWISLIDLASVMTAYAVSIVSMSSVTSGFGSLVVCTRVFVKTPDVYVSASSAITWWFNFSQLTLTLNTQCLFASAMKPSQEGASLCPSQRRPIQTMFFAAVWFTLKLVVSSYKKQLAFLTLFGGILCTVLLSQDTSGSSVVDYGFCVPFRWPSILGDNTQTGFPGCITFPWLRIFLHFYNAWVNFIKTYCVPSNPSKTKLS